MTGAGEDFRLDRLPLLNAGRLGAVYHASWRGSTGTVFVAHTDKGQCWVTAKHVIDGAVAGDELEVFHDGALRSLTILEVVYSDELDIAVFTTTILAKQNKPMLLAEGCSVFPGQSVAILGFPHGLNQFTELNRRFPIPICKMGAFAGAFEGLILIDALINPGFSGGPVIAYDDNGQKTKLLGVISEFRPEVHQIGTIWDTSDPDHAKQLPNLIAELHSGLTIVISTGKVNQLASRLTNYPS